MAKTIGRRWWLLDLACSIAVPNVAINPIASNGNENAAIKNDGMDNQTASR